MCCMFYNMEKCTAALGSVCQMLENAVASSEQHGSAPCPLAEPGQQEKITGGLGVLPSSPSKGEYKKGTTLPPNEKREILINAGG